MLFYFDQGFVQLHEKKFKLKMAKASFAGKNIVVTGAGEGNFRSE